MALEGYGKYTTEALDQERTELDRKFGDILKVSVGRNVVRLLPPAAGEASPWKLIYMHFIEMPDGLTIPFVCPKKMSNEPCPICEQAEKLRQSGDAAQFERAKKYFPRRQWYANVIDRNDEEKGPQLLPVGKEILDQINTQIRERLLEDPEFDICDPYGGIDVIINRKGQLQNDTEYKVALRTAKSQLGPDDDTMQTWIDARHDLHAKAKPMSYQEILNSIRAAQTSPGGGGGGGNTRNDRQLPPSRQQQPAPRRTIEASVTRPVETSEDEFDDSEFDDAPPDDDADNIPF